MDSWGEEQYQPPRRRHRALPFLLGLPFATPNLYTDSPAAVGRSLARSAGPRLESALQQILQRIDPVFGARNVNDLYVLAADQLEQDESASQLLINRAVISRERDGRRTRTQRDSAHPAPLAGRASHRWTV